MKHVLGFLTIIPAGSNNNIEGAARSMWLFPLVGAGIAFIAALTGTYLEMVFPLTISMALTLFILLFLTGFHHLDGLLDFGDALMYRGTIEERRKVLKDVNTGVGGFALGFFVILLTYLALTETRNLIPALITAEVCAKFSVVQGAYTVKTAHEGAGSAFVKAMKKNHRMFLLSEFIFLGIVLVLNGSFGIVIAVLTILTSSILTGISSRKLGGVSGDAFGAMNEITRMAVLLLLVTVV